MSDPSTIWILLLRGINVGGNNPFPMADLRRHLGSLGAQDVNTYIQSGNAVFRASAEVVDELPQRLAAVIEEHHGFRSSSLVLGRDELEAAAAANPYPEAESEPKSLHLFFLASPPEEPDLAALAEVQLPSERYHLADRVLYLHAPDGIARSKLVSRLGRCLGVDMTARNWRTVQKLLEMASSD